LKDGRLGITTTTYDANMFYLLGKVGGRKDTMLLELLTLLAFMRLAGVMLRYLCSVDGEFGVGVDFLAWGGKGRN